VDKLWSRADAGKVPVKDCHEMVQAGDGRLFLLTNVAQNNVLIYDVDGALLETWTLKLGGAHGLTLHREADGREFLYVTDPGAGRVIKTTLAGEVVMELPQAGKCGAYKETEEYRPTETAVAPNGDIYVADGYGSQYVLRFDREGKFISKFGGKSTQPLNPGKFMQAHGVAMDLRGEEPLLVVTERIRNEFNWFTLEGEFKKGVYLPGAYVSRPVIAGEHLYSGVCFGAREDDSFEVKAQLFAKAMRWQPDVANLRLKSMPFHESGIGWFFRFRTFLLQEEREDALQLNKVFPSAEIADWGWHRIDEIPVAPYYYLSNSLKSFTRRGVLN
jgi:hypothetical protein